MQGNGEGVNYSVSMVLCWESVGGRRRGREEGFFNIHRRNPQRGSALLGSVTLFHLGLEINSNINNFGKYCSNFGVIGQCM